MIQNTAIYAVLTAFGSTLGTIFYRGSRRINLEKRSEEYRLIFDELLERYKNLPKDTPEEIRREFLNNIKNLENAHAIQIEALLKLPQKKHMPLIENEKSIDT